jgi:integrase
MRGSIRQRSKTSWQIILEYGYVRDRATGRRKRVQKHVAFHGTKRQAQDKLTDLLHDATHGTFIEPDKRTVGEWLDEWVELAIKPPRRTPRTYDTYRSVISLHLKPALGSLRLQGLRVLDIEAMVAEKGRLAPATLEKILTVLGSALKAAERNQLVARNVATLLANRPQAAGGHSVENCWTAEEAATFMRAAIAAGPRQAAFYGLALDSGCRKSELAGLRWPDVDLNHGKILVRQQLLKGGPEPVFVPTKGKRARTIDIGPQTVELLRVHKRQQAALKLRHRREFHDHGLVFCKDWSSVGRRCDTLGHPLSINNLGQREFAKLIAAADVKPITLHGLRHTSASLLLSTGVPPHVVQQRLGHKRVEITLDLYAHVLPGQQRDAARQLGALIYQR